MTEKEIRERLDSLLDKKDFTTSDYKEAERLLSEWERIEHDTNQRTC